MLLQGTYPILQGQKFQLTTISTVVATVRAWAKVLYDDASEGMMYISDSTISGSLVQETWQSNTAARLNGQVVQLGVSATGASSAPIQRGQLLARATVVGTSGSFPTLLGQDYIYDSGLMTLGQMRDSGPGGGSGTVGFVTVKSQSAPAAQTTQLLAGTHRIRRILGFAWYFKCSAAAASRTLDVSLRNPWTASTPTSFTAAIGDVWRATQMTLTASQEGTMFAGPGLASQNTNGTITRDNQASAPGPFPILIAPRIADGAGDVATLEFLTANGDSGDRDVITLMQEQWVVF